MGEANVTIVVAPRERFGLSARSLETIYRHTDVPFELVYVDGNSPRGVRRSIEDARRRHGFRLVRTERYLSPNQARNIGLREATTEYVVFVDNDLLVTDGWLGSMLSCAEETGAWVVGPLYLEGDPADEIVHMAGGDLAFAGEPGRRSFTTTHRYQGTAIPSLATPLVRESVGFVEFHCMLVRRDVFDRLGPLDEELLNTREHLDLCIQVRDAGGDVVFEPSSVVTYRTPPPIDLVDVPYFWLRWSEEWTQRSLGHFVAKYGIDPSYTDRIGIVRSRRQLVFAPAQRATRRLLGERAERLASRGLFRAERAVNKAVVRGAPTA